MLSLDKMTFFNMIKELQYSVNKTFSEYESFCFYLKIFFLTIFCEYRSWKKLNIAIKIVRSKISERSCFYPVLDPVHACKLCVTFHEENATNLIKLNTITKIPENMCFFKIHLKNTHIYIYIYIKHI